MTSPIDRIARLSQSLASLQGRYLELVQHYKNLPPSTRQDLRLNFGGDRFRCAALFQHLPPDRPVGASSAEMRGRMSERDPHLPIIELCPVSRQWYADLIAAEELLSQTTWPEIVSDAVLLDVYDHLQNSEQSYQEAKALLQRVQLSVPPGYLPDSIGFVLEHWNHLCLRVRKGAPLEEAATRQGMIMMNSIILPTLPPVEPQQRFWFDHELPSVVYVPSFGFQQQAFHGGPFVGQQSGLGFTPYGPGQGFNPYFGGGYDLAAVPSFEVDMHAYSNAPEILKE